MNCPNCGNEINDNQKFCTKCGTKVINYERGFIDYLIKYKVAVISVTFLLIISIVIIALLTLSTDTVKKSDSSASPSILNCKDYEELDMDNRHDFEYYQNYIQCIFDEKLKKLNQEHKIVEQDKYFENLGFILEHVYSNAEKYGDGIPDPLPGKYDSMDKIYSAYDRYYIPYNLGKIALGAEYVGPDSMYGDGTWNDYYDVTKDKYRDYGNKTENEQVEIVSNVVSLTKFLLETNKFSDTYHKDTYIVELLGLIDNTNNRASKEELKDFVIKLWNSQKEHNMDFELIVDTEIFTNNQLDNFKVKEIEDYKNLKYDKKALGQAYLDARTYCDVKVNEKDENGIYLYAGTGCYEGCISDYFEENDMEYKKVYDIIWNYCSITRQESEGLAGVRACLMTNFEKMTQP